MSSVQAQQESENVSRDSTTTPVPTPALGSGGAHPVAEAEESGAIGRGMEVLTTLLTASADGETVASPTLDVSSAEASESRAATPRPTAAREHIPGLQPFPPPPAVPRTTPPGVHRGPATSSSLSECRSGLDPRAAPFAPQDPAQAFLRRGPPPGTRDPMQIPNDPAAGFVMANEAARARFMESAARHAAMVHKRMIDADSEIHANHLDREFGRVFGRAYHDALVEVIANPPESTVVSNGDEDEDGNGDGDDLYGPG